MDENASRKIQLVCAWSGLIFVILFGITFIILPHNYPPPDPGYTAQDLVDNYYLKYQSRILLGQSLSAAVGPLYMIWCCQLAIQMRRREPTPILSQLKLAGGILTSWLVIFPPVMWAWCAEVAGTVDPKTIQMVHFIAWYMLDMTYGVTTIEGIAVFLLVMLDKQKPALMPHWAAWLGLATSLVYIPLTALPYFKTGIFAINGYWSFHAVFGLFTSVASYYMAQDLKRERIPAVLGIGQAISRSQFGGGRP
jgi:hypothetical protein